MGLARALGGLVNTENLVVEQLSVGLPAGPARGDRTALETY
jgi:hypothetical protein